MKNIILVLSIVIVFVFGLVFVPKDNVEYDYLRLHIRANSNEEIDQNVKLEVKNELVKFLTPLFEQVESKEKAIKIVESNKYVLTSVCVDTLQAKGFFYSVNIKIANEYFPTRTYVNTTLESGYYDAVIVELGEAKGDNWWCGMYTPLCFVNKNENVNQIKYKSKFKEWWQKLFN